jgi:hypothetical protein
MSTSERTKSHDHAAGTSAEPLRAGRPIGRLQRVGVCVPASLIARAAEVAASTQTTRNAVLKIALERGIDTLDSHATAASVEARVATRKRAPEGIEQLRFRIGIEEKGRIEAFARRNRYRDLPPAIADLVTTALDAYDLGDNVPATKADEIDQRLVELRHALDRIGPGVQGILGLLAHWATQSGSLEVEEDELIDEAWAAGEQAWAMREEIAADSPRKNPVLDDEDSGEKLDAGSIPSLTGRPPAAD